MEENLAQKESKLHKYLFTVTSFSKFLAMLLFIVLPFVGFYLGMKYQALTNQPINDNTSLDNITSSSSNTVAAKITGKPSKYAYPTFPPIQTKTFVSKDLGISFMYPVGGDTYPSNFNLEVKVVGTKILLGNEINSIQVFKKDPSETLEQAVIKNVLSGYSLSVCQIKSYPNSAFSKYMNLNFPNHEAIFIDNTTEVANENSNCPAYFTPHDGNNFFVTDINHPDKFIFIRSGVSVLNVTPNNKDGKSWVETIKML